MSAFSFYLSPRPPFRLDLTVSALRRLPHNAVDAWNGTTYTRVLAMREQAVKIAVTQPSAGRIRITLYSGERSPGESLKPAVTRLLEKMLGVRKDLAEFYRFASGDKDLSRIAGDFRGVKPPRFSSIFEAVINGIACQQLSLNVGITLLNRLAAAFGRTAGNDSEATMHAFPLPEDLAAAAPADLRGLGFSLNKALSVISTAQAFLDETLHLEELDLLPDEEALGRLLQLRGIGRWTAEYVMLRGLGRIHIFPGDDVGAQNELRRRLHLRKRPDYAKIRTITRQWYPFAGFLYFHFLLDKLRARGLLVSSPGYPGFPETSVSHVA